MLKNTDALIRQDRHVTIILPLQLSVSHTGTNEVIGTLRYSKLCARWLPQRLPAEHRPQRKTISSKLLELFDVEGGGGHSVPNKLHVMKPGCSTTLCRRWNSCRWNAIILKKQQWGKIGAQEWFPHNEFNELIQHRVVWSAIKHFRSERKKYDEEWPRLPWISSSIATRIQR